MEKIAVQCNINSDENYEIEDNESFEKSVFHLSLYA